MKALRIFAETAITAGGLGLVIITLSGSTRTIAIWISLVSVILYPVSQLAEGGSDD